MRTVIGICVNCGASVVAGMMPGTLWHRDTEHAWCYKDDSSGPHPDPIPDNERAKLPTEDRAFRPRRSRFL
jgi:hypothetical protein